MSRLASPLSRTTTVAALLTAVLADAAGAASIYRWHDVAGGLHFSNRPEVVPGYAREVELPPIPTASVPVAGRSATAARLGAGTVSRPVPALSVGRGPSWCGTPDPTGLIDAVTTRLARDRQLGSLTLLVAGVPVVYRSGTITTMTSTDLSGDLLTPVEQAAIVYPDGTLCPARPALARYAASSGRRGASRSICDDYRRAFAEVGIAVSRDQRIARSFHAIADDFSAIATGGYIAGRRAHVAAERRRDPTRELRATETIAELAGPSIELPPWIVEAHIAQTGAIGDEAAELVEELTVALGEIDGAARARGCW